MCENWPRIGGAPDATFGGGDGKVFVRLSPDDDYPADVAVLPSGRFLVAGQGQVPSLGGVPQASKIINPW